MHTAPARLGRVGLVALLGAAASISLVACGTTPRQPGNATGEARTDETRAGTTTARRTADEVVIESPPGVPRPPYKFTRDDEALLDGVQHGAFLYLWNEASATTGMVRDRSSKEVVSIAGVGFQLSAIPIGIERGWVSRAIGEARVKQILAALIANPSNRKAGLYYHFLDATNAGPATGAYEHTVSTIDSALLFAGVITAGSYFSGEIGAMADAIIDEADWSFFVLNETEKPYEAGFISLGWQPTKPDEPTGAGKLLPFVWADAGDEHRLVTLLAVGATRPEHRVDASLYYRLRRQLGDAGVDTGGGGSSLAGIPESRLMVWFPWSGALFTNFFAHCWINYARLVPDNPAAFGAKHRASVDWWENARRAVRMHQARCAENPLGLPTLSARAWGLTASDVASGYAVPGLFPTPIDMLGARPEYDYSTFKVKDDYGDGTIAPYAAGASIMFEPSMALEALRHYRTLTRPDGSPLVWRAPSVDAKGYGFQDSFNLGTGWVAPDCVAIDQGPLILAIENARTGNVWRWFESSEAIRTAYDRLGFVKRPK